MLPDLPLGMARQFHACTHTTIAPTVVRGGTKTNVIPDRVDLQLDIRTLPGTTATDVRALLDDALGELADRVEVVEAFDDPATGSPVDTPLWDSLGRVTQAFYAGSHLVPMLSVGATDARFFRRLGTTSYGFGLFSRKLTFEEFGRMFHGDDERVDVESLRLSTEMWQALARDLLGGLTVRPVDESRPSAVERERGGHRVEQGLVRVEVPRVHGHGPDRRAVDDVVLDERARLRQVVLDAQCFSPGSSTRSGSPRCSASVPNSTSAGAAVSRSPRSSTMSTLGTETTLTLVTNGVPSPSGSIPVNTIGRGSPLGTRRGCRPAPRRRGIPGRLGP